jgi:hypothetical protein
MLLSNDDDDPEPTPEGEPKHNPQAALLILEEMFRLFGEVETSAMLGDLFLGKGSI